MSNIDELTRKRQQYYNLKSKVTDIKNNLKEAIDKIEAVDSNVIKGYSIDEVRGDNGYLSDQQSSIQETYSNLVNTVIPEINKQINILTNKIENAIVDID